jgi:hypothetical protein
MNMWKAVMTLSLEEERNSHRDFKGKVIMMTELKQLFYWRLPNVKQKLITQQANPNTRQTEQFLPDRDAVVTSAATSEADSENLATASDPIDMQKASYLLQKVGGRDKKQAPR